MRRWANEITSVTLTGLKFFYSIAWEVRVSNTAHISPVSLSSFELGITECGEKKVVMPAVGMYL